MRRVVPNRAKTASPGRAKNRAKTVSAGSWSCKDGERRILVRQNPRSPPGRGPGRAVDVYQGGCQNLGNSESPRYNSPPRPSLAPPARVLRPSGAQNARKNARFDAPAAAQGVKTREKWRDWLLPLPLTHLGILWLGQLPVQRDMANLQALRVHSLDGVVPGRMLGMTGLRSGARLRQL